jgi:hypothetical protein
VEIKSIYRDSSECAEINIISARNFQSFLSLVSCLKSEEK